MNPDKLYLAIYFNDNNEKIRVSVTDYLNLVTEKNKIEISNFIYNRLHARYIKPFQFENNEYKTVYLNGFSIMANSCLLIETLESFKQGLEDTNRISERIFVNFLKTEPNFEFLKPFANRFYQHVRCGILHQGETTGGWVLIRESENIFDEEKLRINSNLFLLELEKSLVAYKLKLQSEEWDSEIWDNFRNKMRKIIANCEN